MSDTLLVDQSEGVLTVTLNRPEVLNAFNEQMLRELHEALRQAERDAAVRCVLLTGAGRGVWFRQDLPDPARAAALFLPQTPRHPPYPGHRAIPHVAITRIAPRHGLA